MVKRYWKDTWQYQRILEILDDYWQTEKDEKFISVDMYFEHKDGQTQEKHIRWWNPNIEHDDNGPDSEAHSLGELMNVEFVGRDKGGSVELVRDPNGDVIGLRNWRTGQIDYFEKRREV